MLALAVALALQLQAPCRAEHVRVQDGLPGPEGGLLSPIGAYPAGQNGGASLGGGGRVAFVATIEGLARNQGVFVADELGLSTIALGCGGEAGSGQLAPCGDPAPTGGTFGGFHYDGRFAPEVNAAGDVLFMADVVNGPTPRGLFLFRAATGAMEKVVAIGDPTPLGLDVVGVGPGSLNEAGDVACIVLVEDPPFLHQHAVLRWSGGLITLVAAAGTPGPGGPYQSVGGGSQSHTDGSWTATSVVPALAEDGRIALWAVQDDAPGIAIHPPSGPPTWAARLGESAIGGGAFWSFDAPTFGGAGGELAFTATTIVGSGQRRAVVAGVPGAWRELLAAGDPLAEGSAVIGRSAGPFRWLAPDGSVLIQAGIALPGPGTIEDAVLRVRPNGGVEVIARQGDATALGVVEELFPWPSLDAQGRIALSATFSSGPATRGSWIVAPCGTPMAHCESKPASGGCLPRISSSGSASATSPLAFLVIASELAPGQPGMLFYGFAPASAPFQGGTLCVAAPIARTAPATSSGAGVCGGVHAFDFGARILGGVDPMLVAGATVHAQWWLRDPADPAGFGTGLTDALAFTIAP